MHGTLSVVLQHIDGVSDEDVKGGPVYCCVRLKQPHRFLFLRSDPADLSSGAATLDQELLFDGVILSPNAEGTLIVDVCTDDEMCKSRLIGKIRLLLEELPSASQAFTLLSGQLTLKCELAAAPEPETYENTEPTGVAIAGKKLPLPPSSTSGKPPLPPPSAAAKPALPALVPSAAFGGDKLTPKTKVATSDIEDRLRRARGMTEALQTKLALPPNNAAPASVPPAPAAPGPPPKTAPDASGLPPKTGDKPDADEMDSFHFCGQRARPRKKIEYAPKVHETYLKPPHSLLSRWGAGVNVEAECCEQSALYVLDATEQTQISECKGCRIVIAPVNGSAFLIECVDCIISVAARQIRLRDCVNCELRVWAPSDTALIIETCDHLSLGEWELEYDGLEEQFGLARIDATKPNYWDKVYDFSPSANRSEKHYTLLPKRTGAPVRLEVTPEGLHGGRVVERGADAKTVALLAKVLGGEALPSEGAAAKVTAEAAAASEGAPVA
jgi:hypothetical protein